MRHVLIVQIGAQNLILEESRIEGMKEFLDAETSCED